MNNSEWFDRGLLDEIIENSRKYQHDSIEASKDFFYNLDIQLEKLDSDGTVTLYEFSDFDTFYKSLIESSKTTSAIKHVLKIPQLKTSMFQAKKIDGKWMFKRK